MKIKAMLAELIPQLIQEGEDRLEGKLVPRLLNIRENWDVGFSLHSERMILLYSRLFRVRGTRALLKQLNLKFGSLAISVEQQVNSVNEETLDHWIESINGSLSKRYVPIKSWCKEKDTE